MLQYLFDLVLSGVEMPLILLNDCRSESPPVGDASSALAARNRLFILNKREEAIHMKYLHVALSPD